MGSVLVLIFGGFELEPALLLVFLFEDHFNLVEVDINLGVVWDDGIEEVKVELVLLRLRDGEADADGLLGESVLEEIFIFESVLDLDSDLGHRLVPLELDFFFLGLGRLFIGFRVRLVFDIDDLNRLLLEGKSLAFEFCVAFGDLNLDSLFGVDVLGFFLRVFEFDQSGLEIPIQE